jgi:electron transfer flavoprotein alpha subunit
MRKLTDVGALLVALVCVLAAVCVVVALGGVDAAKGLELHNLAIALGGALAGASRPLARSRGQ